MVVAVWVWISELSRNITRANKTYHLVRICKDRLSKYIREYGQRGGILPFFQLNGGIGNTRPREALPRAPTWPKFNSDALARPAAHAQGTHLFFFEHTVGANGTAAQEGY